MTKTKKAEAKERIYMLSGGKSPLTYSIPNKHTASRPLLVVDEESGRQRAIRYSRNQKSQYMDEQDEHTIVDQIVFQDGKLIAPKTNFQLQDFLSIHPDNEANGGSKFYEYDPEKQAQEEVDWINAELDAQLMVRDMDFEKLKSIALILLGEQVNRMQSSEIRHNVLLIAREDPYQILEMTDDTDNEVMATVIRAFSNKYVFTKGGKDIHYNLENNKSKILTIKHGMTAEDALAQWLVSDAGTDFYEFLQSKLDK